MSAESIAKALGGATRSGGGWVARCPSHDDRTPSLKIDEADGRVLVHCFAGCQQQDIIEALKARGLWPQKTDEHSKAGKQITATYDYRGPGGELLYQVVRYDPKDFRQRRPDGAGRWIWNMAGVELVPYRLPKIIAARKHGQTFYVVEGEKDVEALHRLGLAATCNPGGVGKWRTKFAKWFEDVELVILPDNDDIGAAHAQKVAASLHRVAASVRIVQLPNLPPKGDVSDWIARGGTVDDIQRLCEDASEWQPTNERPTGENANTDENFAKAKAAVVDLASRAKKDPGVPFEAEALRAQAKIRHADPAAFARLKADLKSVGVPMRDWERELRRASLRVIQGGGQDSDTIATTRAGPYLVRNGMICLEKDTKDGPVTVPLCNFSASIVSEEVRDDGAERRTVFAVEGAQQGGKALTRAEVAAERFPSMNWVTASWGTSPVIFAGYGVRDHLRAAIQMLSGEVPRRTVFAHLGWRRIGDQWIFLYAGGAIGADGAVEGISVTPSDGRLGNYVLPDLPQYDALREAVRASLDMLDVAPAPVVYPLLAAIYRAPLGEAAPIDLSAFVVGPTGCQKTELTALAQAHFGAAFNGRNLPGNWSSSANSLEKQAFLTKDVVFVVDDFCPVGTTADVSRFHREADRLLRNAGNRAGRARMRPDGSLRPEYYPRGLIIASGEDIPRGQSLRARQFVLEVSPGVVDLAILTTAQEYAATGLFAQAMVGYVAWLATQMDALKSDLPARQRVLRERARADVSAHDRTPEIVASLWVGIETFLRFALEIGAITITQADWLRKAGWTALIEVARAQADHQAGEDPTIRFLSLVAAAISSGRAHVADAETGKVPEDAYRWGWREHAVGTGEFAHGEWRAEGKQVGWCDGENILLDPDAAYATAQGLAREQGTSLAVSQQTLWKRLAEKGVLASRDVSRGRNKVRWQIVGRRRSVIHINAATLAMETGPIGPHDPEQAKTQGLKPQTRDGLEDAPAKAAHENGPKAPEYVGSGPIGPIGPEMSHKKKMKPDLDVESADDGWET